MNWNELKLTGISWYQLCTVDWGFRFRISRQKSGAFSEKSGPPAKNPGLSKDPKPEGSMLLKPLCPKTSPPPPFQYQRKSRKGLGVPIAKKNNLWFFVLPPCNKTKKGAGFLSCTPRKMKPRACNHRVTSSFWAEITWNHLESPGITWNKLK